MIAVSELASWTDGAARRAVTEFVERTVSDGVPAARRLPRRGGRGIAGMSDADWKGMPSFALAG